MTRKNPDYPNLDIPDTETARERGRKGVKVTQQIVKKRKTLREAYLAIASEKAYKPIGELAELIAKEYGDITVDEAIMLGMVAKAVNGDSSAAAFIRDTIGEKSAEQVDTKIEIKMSGLEDFAK